MSTRRQRYVNPGDMVRVIGNYSEVMCHMRVAGKPIVVELLYKHHGTNIYFYAQVYKDLRPCGGPITTGEAGFFFDSEKNQYYTYEDYGPGDENPQKVIKEARDLIESAIKASGVEVTTITNLGLG
jgi:hypothetical protein